MFKIVALFCWGFNPFFLRFDRSFVLAYPIALLQKKSSLYGSFSSLNVQLCQRPFLLSQLRIIKLKDKILIVVAEA